MTKTVGVALLGLGTVGGGTYRILRDKHEMIKKTQGLDLKVECIIERNEARIKEMGVDPAIVSTDINDVLKNDNIKVVAEFFGGIEPAKTFLIKCLLAGKSIVTANKELFSKYWHELEVAAKKGKAGLYFEASCVGGVPIIRTLTDSMQGNNIRSIKGIINGTTNYILTKMSNSGMSYAEALAQAQSLGYAEANPTADVEGFDASYKISILSSLAFRRKVPLDKVYREGITNVSPADIAFGKEMGFVVKLLAIAKDIDGKTEVRVHPAFVPKDSPLASVSDSFNAVLIEGDAVGDVMLYGRGAGDLPTGSAIVSDIVVAASRDKHKLSCFKNDNRHIPAANFVTDFVSEYYVRILVKDEVGVLAELTEKFSRYGVSINILAQKEGAGVVPLVFITHKTQESNVNKALSKIALLPSVIKIESVIRVER